ncbi:YHYH protein [Hellea sp.]|nr:YHYH protein [Hellea sp.]
MTQLKNALISTSALFLCSGVLIGCTASAKSSEDEAPKRLTENRVEITIKESQRCFVANGLPDHPTGDFPNRGNPNAIERQDVNVCVPLEPVRAEFITQIRGTMGIAINGVQFRPNTAGYYDPEGRRGHSPRGDKNWSIDIFGARGKLGLDFNNAHVGRGGLYHYHGIAKHLLDTSGSSLIGYAGDGYEIHYLNEDVQSGWDLKAGERPSGPGGRYDGTYNEDFTYVGGIDANEKPRLDPCNGGELSGRYVYFVTDSYPYVPRCLVGVVSEDFNKANHNAERGERGPRTGNRDGRRGEGRRGEGGRGPRQGN